MSRVSSRTLEKLRGLVRSLDTNEFYREHWGEARLGDGRPALEEFLRRAPLLRKSDVVDAQAEKPPYGGLLNVPESALRQLTMTGGTSGKGTEVYGLTGSDAAALGRTFGDGVASMGFPEGTRIATTFPMSLSAAPQWIHTGLTSAGYFVLPVGSYGTEQKLQIIRNFDVDVLIATPSYAEYIAQALIEAGRDPRTDLGLQALIVATESLTVSRVEKLEQLFGAKLYEWYGSTQRGMAFTCEHGAVRDHRSGVLHIDHEAIFAEVIDVETGKPLIDLDTREPIAGASETVVGELVITYLDVEATPLVRFATGDLVHAVGSGCCPCGRAGFGIVSGSISRLDGMLKIRGVSVDPARVDAHVLGSPFVKDYRVQLRRAGGRESIAVTALVAEGHDPSESVRAVEALFLEAAGLNAEVSLAEEEFDVFDDTRHKARRWTDAR